VQRQQNADSASAVKPVLTVGDAVGSSQPGAATVGALVPVLPSAQLTGGKKARSVSALTANSQLPMCVTDQELGGCDGSYICDVACKEEGVTW